MVLLCYLACRILSPSSYPNLTSPQFLKKFKQLRYTLDKQNKIHSICHHLHTCNISVTKVDFFSGIKIYDKIR